MAFPQKNEKWNYPMISNLGSGYMEEDYEVSIWKRESSLVGALQHYSQ